MSREILFRGKRADNGQWAVSRCPLGTMVGGSVLYDFDPVTVGQYTGLTDKNGVKIFEGDIVKLKDYHGQRVVKVFWGRCGSWFHGGDGYSDEYFFNSSQREVVGNIYDNAELLKQEEKGGWSNRYGRPREREEQEMRILFCTERERLNVGVAFT